MKKVNVIGAGFSGLVSAYYLSKENIKVRIFESSNRCGGLINTIQTEYGPVERAASGILHSEAVESLFHDLNLKKVDFPPFIRKKYIFRERVRRWPLSTCESIRLMSLGLDLKLFKKKLSPYPFETLSTWASRYQAVSSSFLNFLLYPALQGIYGGSSEGLSSKLVLGPVLNSVRENSKSRGTVYPQGGMSALIDRLVDYLKKQGVEIFLNSPVDTLDLSTENVIALSAWDAERLLKKSEGLPSDFIQGLGTIHSSPLGSVSFVRQHTTQDYRGFGVLFPGCENFNSLGVLLTDGNFCDPEKTGVIQERFIFGVGSKADLSELTHNQLIQLALEDRERLYGRKFDDLTTVASIRLDAIPRYDVDTERAISRINELKVKNVYLIGNYLGRIGLSQILEVAKKFPRKLRIA